MPDTDARKIEELLTRGVAEVIDRDALSAALASGKTLRVKLGIDPTSPNLHLGRSVPLLKLRDFQELGHQIVFIVGDFTGIVGDTSDKESERPMLDPDTVKQNMASYVEQAGKVIDLEKVEVRHNSEWLASLGFGEIGRLADLFSLSEFMARENIKKRYDAGKRISLRELLYPLMQGYDSVAVEADVELGGTDQRFNLLAGREIQRASGMEPQNVIMNDLILGTDGRKMSSSWGNTINLTDSPRDMFQKVMNIPDDLIVPYLIHCTRVPMEAVEDTERRLESGDDPRVAKRFLAEALVTLYHSQEAAEKESKYSLEMSQGGVPEEVAEWEPVPRENLESFIARIGFAESKSDARRKIEQGGVTLDSEKQAVGTLVLEPEAHDGKVLRVGKKNIAKIVFGGREVGVE